MFALVAYKQEPHYILDVVVKDTNNMGLETMFTNFKSNVHSQTTLLIVSWTQIVAGEREGRKEFQSWFVWLLAQKNQGECVGQYVEQSFPTISLKLAWN